MLTAFEGGPVPPVLTWDMRDPYELFGDSTPYDMSIPYDVYPPGRIIPLFSNHTGDIIVGLRERGEPLGFLRFSLESEPGQPPWIEGASWQQIVVHILTGLWEGADANEAGDAVVREAAKVLAFDEVDRFLVALRDPARESFDSHDAWHLAFLATLPPYQPPSPAR